MAQPARADALDVLRGAAILMMVLSGIIPFGGALPGWMYHAQVPPPAHVFDATVPGITWVDLVFPFFLFALGAALPLALGRRAEQGASWWRLGQTLVTRTALLLFFAVFLQHMRPTVMHPGADRPVLIWLTALAAWAVLWGIYLRVPSSWPHWSGWVARIAGWAGAVALLTTVTYPNGSGFSIGRYDIILVVLAHMVWSGGAVYLLTRTRPVARYAVLAVLTAAILAGREDGWVAYFMNASWFEGLWRPYYLKYLLIVVPGVFAGEALRTWMQAAAEPESRPAWNALALALLGLALQFVVVIGLYVRETGWVVLLSLVLGLAGWALNRGQTSSTDRLVAYLWTFGMFWLLLGLVAEPFEGGIKKDFSTFSYYFVNNGLAAFLLASLTLIFTHTRVRFPLTRANGQNPMLAYATLGNLVLPLFALTGAMPLLASLTPTPWLGFLRGAFYTFLVALVVWGCSKLRLFWRT